ncbi:MAG TPA: type II secretion system protein [Candidatus Paceibacterota bacterium]|nr:type II secretion system protein [Candidatus Paceibacterota bacterium]
MRAKTGGWTMAEMIIVIAVIALLASVVIPNLVGSKGHARDTSRISDLKQIQLAFRTWRDDYSTSTYPVYASGDVIGDGVGVETVFAPYVGGTIKDPIDSGSNRYYYDSDYTCNGASHVIVMALTMEEATSGNYESVCGAGSEGDLGNGVTPTAASYVVILK